jgi:serine-type D-Ala-D-Ala carboxypeptidase/endopeptidase (penicillin-binding protein 4)
MSPNIVYKITDYCISRSLNELIVTLIFRSGFIMVILINIGSPSFGQPIENIQSQVQMMARSNAFQHATVGFCLVDPNNGKVIASYNKESSLLPASTLKLVTTACAMEKLGMNGKFVTYLTYRGKIHPKGELTGDIMVKGGGDPTFGSNRFDEKNTLDFLLSKWANTVSIAGISRIKGNIYADASIFEDELIPPSWVWIDMGNYFGAGASGLTVNENIYHLVFRPGKKIGDTATILRTEPETGLTFKNYVTTSSADTRDMAYITGAFYNNYRSVMGTVPMKGNEFKIKGSLSDPPQYLADEFKRKLVYNGISVDGGAYSTRIKGIEKSEWVKLDSVVSPSISEIIVQTNLKSVNLYAEHLLKHLGYKTHGMGSTMHGLKVVESFIAEETGNSKGVYLADGSGLALSNLFTADKMTEFLYKIKSEPWFEKWLKSLPIAGKSGTASSICKGTAAEGKIFLKSGTMQRVKAYAGYVKGKSGGLYPFAIFVNNYFGKSQDINKQLEELMVKMVELP